MTTKLARMTEMLSRSPSTWNIGTTTELSVTAKAVDEEEVKDGAAEAESRRV